MTSSFSDELCGDLFEDPEFSWLLDAIEPMGEADAIRTLNLAAPAKVTLNKRRLARVFSIATTWTFSRSEIDGLYGCTEPDRVSAPRAAKVFIYRTASDGGDIHGLSIRELSRRLKSDLVSSHELGHVVNLLSGRYVKDPANEEDRATLFGSYVAQCVIRNKLLMASIGSAGIDPFAPVRADGTVDHKHVRDCTIWRWTSMERLLVDLRRSWRKNHNAEMRGLFAGAKSKPLTAGREGTVIERCPE